MASRLTKLAVVVAILRGAAILGSDPAHVALWRDGKPSCRLVLPSGAARLAHSTFAYFLRRFYNLDLPAAPSIDQPGMYSAACLTRMLRWTRAGSMGSFGRPCSRCMTEEK